VLVKYSDLVGKSKAQDLLLAILRCAEELNPAKDSIAYWTCVNHAMLDSDPAIRPLWQSEKIATIESIAAAKEEALYFLASEREKILRMDKDEAIRLLIHDRNFHGREKTIRSQGDNGIFSIA
jgi:type II restriction enzyme